MFAHDDSCEHIPIFCIKRINGLVKQQNKVEKSRFNQKKKENKKSGEIRIEQKEMYHQRMNNRYI